MSLLGFPGGSVVKNPSANAGDAGSIPELGRSPGEGNANPLQHPHLGNPMDRWAWQATVYEVIKSQTWLTNVPAPGKYHSTLSFYEYDYFVKRVELMLNVFYYEQNQTHSSWAEGLMIWSNGYSSPCSEHQLIHSWCIWQEQLIHVNKHLLSTYYVPGMVWVLADSDDHTCRVPSIIQSNSFHNGGEK